MKKLKRTDNVVAAVAASVEKNRRQTVRELASMLDLTFATVKSTLTIDLARKKVCLLGTQAAVHGPKR